MSAVPRIALRPGYEISRLIRGGWQLSGDHGPVDAARAAAGMVDFFDAGITAFDCADIYAGVEEIYGHGLRALARARGTAAARAVRIHTKYVPDIASLASLRRADTEAIVTRSLRRLGRERLDLVQFHWWNYAVPGMLDVLGHLVDLQAAGLIERIGVTNFDAAHMAQIAGAVDLVSAQVQFSLLDRRPAGTFARIARESSTHLICYGVLAGGFLTDAWLGKPDPGFDFANRSLVKYRLIVEEFGGWALFQELLACLRAIADRHGADIAAVAIRAMLEEPEASAVIVGARHAGHLPRTLKALEFSLTPEDRAGIAAIQARAAGPSGPVYGLERDRDGPHGRIMKYNLNADA
ncbi:MAG: aldo/keto reductase [Alphaproteobacteria bacterium]|nr:MAG: aldo/keto reductase [Alphaproteobacteria bacterium]